MRKFLRKWLGITEIVQEINIMNDELYDLDEEVDSLRADKADETYVDNEIERLRSDLDKEG